MRWQAGYTIIEVTLFLAITGLLLVVVLAGTGSSLSNNRYTDTNRSFESAIAQAYTSVRDGEVVRGTDTSGKATCAKGGISETTYPGSSNICQVIGKLLVLTTGNDSKISFYNVVADISPTVGIGCPAAGIDNVKCYNPRVLDMGSPTSEYTPEWQAKMKQGGEVFQSNTNTSLNTEVPLVSILRDPTSELVYVTGFNATVPTGNNKFLFKSSLSAQYTNTKGQILLCHDGGRSSYLQFTGGSGVGTVRALTTPLFTWSGMPTC